jgi:hypothetical protein
MGSRSALAALVFTLSACASSGNDVPTVHPPAGDATTSTSFADAILCRLSDATGIHRQPHFS